MFFYFRFSKLNWIFYQILPGSEKLDCKPLRVMEPATFLPWRFPVLDGMEVSRLRSGIGING